MGADRGNGSGRREIRQAPRLRSGEGAEKGTADPSVPGCPWEQGLSGEVHETELEDATSKSAQATRSTSGRSSLPQCSVGGSGTRLPTARALKNTLEPFGDNPKRAQRAQGRQALDLSLVMSPTTSL